MKNLNKYFLFFVLVLPLLSFSQSVSNIHFEQVDKQIHIYYDLAGYGEYNVQVYCSEDEGKTWGNPLRYVTGDVGSNQKTGSNKEIVWDVLKERDKLVKKVVFKLAVQLGNYYNQRIETKGKYPMASEKILNKSDIENFTFWELKIMRNEIFARYGYVFKTESMKEYFNDQTWYREMIKKSPSDNCAEYLTDIEKINIKLIKSVEKIKEN